MNCEDALRVGAASVHVPCWGFAVPPKGVAGVAPFFIRGAKNGAPDEKAIGI